MGPTGALASQTLREYNYAPITSPNTARVLLLNPAKNKSDALSGALWPLELPSHSADEPLNGPHRPQSQPYEALSYLWGDPTVTEAIRLGGDSALNLTSSIADALRRLRLPDRTRAIWADQICVNQKDKAERSQQVKLMGSLYRSTHRVLVWLGRDPGANAGRMRRLIDGLDELFSRAVGADEGEGVDYEKALAEVPAAQWMALSELNWLQYVSLPPPVMDNSSREIILFTLMMHSSAASGSPKRSAGPSRRNSSGGRPARPSTGSSLSAWGAASSNTQPPR